MKRLLMSFVAALLVSPCFADPSNFNRSSFTVTSDQKVYISSSAYLDGVIVGVPTSGGTLIIFNSTAAVNATSAVVISSISLSTVGNYYFNNMQVKGIVYQANTATNGVTILYKK